VLYPNGAVQLELDRNDVRYGEVGSGTNQQNVGEALEGVYAQGGNAVTDQLNIMTTAQAQQALKGLAADEIPSYLSVAEQRMDTLYTTVAGRLAQASREPQSDTVRRGVWAQLQYNGMHTGGQMPLGSPSVTANLGSIAAGYDQALNDQVRVGAAVSVELGSLQFKDRNASGNSTGAQVLAYGSVEPRGTRFYVNGMVGMGGWHNQLDRRVSVGPLAERASGGFNTEAVGAYAEGGIKLAYRVLEIRPYVGTRLNWIRQAGFSESGAPLMGVSADSMSTTHPATLLGVRVASATGVAKLSWEANVAWQHRYGNTSQRASLAFTGSPGQDWTVFGTPLDRDTAHVDATLRYALKPKSSVFLRLATDVGASTTVYSVNAGAQVKF
ncbi:autotransporter outer membrane beta-barrel domain-containing protein, partial [Pandoraea sputorum]|uniref:autotransporter outer membrane beta-barrel domain-containing protein n=1 Tax=Pandoraea sputorum TaxID=93222 RepID=UPI0012413A77